MKLSSYKNIYFLGIGGISMSALAMILKQKQYNVAGYDGVKGTEVEMLEKNSIPVCDKIDEIDLTGFDAVIYTAALSESHPAMVKAAKFGVPFFSRAQLLGAIASTYTHSAGIAGTHGKSTCSGMLARICECAGDSTYIVGAVLPFVNSTYKLGSDSKLVFEACEYMDSFLQFHPSIGVVLNVKHDHVDYFKTQSQMIESFRKYLEGSGCGLINADDPNAVIAGKWSGVPIHTFSVNGDGYYNAVFENKKSGFPEFHIYENGQKTVTVTLSIPGAHNVYNGIAAYGAARLMGITPEQAKEGLEAFTGIKRRFELCENIPSKAKFYLDYAHHPDEIEATLKAARSITAGKLYAVFQPHTYSRLKYFFDGFKQSLGLADELIVTDVYSAREANDQSVSGEKLARYIENSKYISDFKDIANRLLEKVGEKDTVMILGAGDITKLLDFLK